MRRSTLFSLFLVVLLAGALAWPSTVDSGASAAAPESGSSPGQFIPGGVTQPAHARPSHPVLTPAPSRVHDYALAQRGEALYGHWMAEYRLNPDAYAPVLFGSATPHPRAAIYVPEVAWDASGHGGQLELAHYAASLILTHWKAPEVLAGYDSAGPDTGYFRENAAAMTSDSWVILGGDVKGSGGKAVLGSIRVLATGAEWRLSPQD